jgi:hypothetical protein
MCPKPATALTEVRNVPPACSVDALPPEAWREIVRTAAAAPTIATIRTYFGIEPRFDSTDNHKTSAVKANLPASYFRQTAARDR